MPKGPMSEEQKKILIARLQKGKEEKKKEEESKDPSSETPPVDSAPPEIAPKKKEKDNHYIGGHTLDQEQVG